MVRAFGEAPPIPGKKREYNAYGMGWMYRTQEMAAAFARSQLRRLDTYNAVRRGNARYLTERLAAIPGIVPPCEPEGRVHVYHMYFVRFDPGAAGSSMPPRRFRMAVEKAMTAEGVPIGQWQTMLVPAQTLFRTKEGYGRGCPWACPHARQVAYDLAEFPETAKLMDDYTNVPHVAPPNDLRAIKLVADAFEKVLGNVTELEQIDLSEAESAVRGW